MSRLLLACLLSFTLFASASHLNAQSTFGSLVGTIRDPSGAAVPAATITARELDQNTVRSTTSDGEGLYEILNLQAGRYEITAVKSGFATAKVAEARLEARQSIRAHLKLEVATAEQTVLVTGAVPLINTENGTLSESLNSKKITRLPTNYRAFSTNPLYPVVTVPGVQSDGSGNPGGRLSIGGALPSQIETSLDGISILDIRFHTPNANTGPSAEMVSELRVTTAGNSAAFGQTGDIALITKAGSNQVHGSAFWYHQNAALDAKTYGSPQKQHKVFNTFGGSISGPVILPGQYDGHNRTFFFLDYEGNRKPMSQLDEGSVPTLAMRHGDLNGLPGDNAVDPLTGLPFPNNRIPASRISGVARKLLEKYYPAPNLDVPIEDLNYRVLTPVNEYTDGYDVRVDQVLGPRQQIFVRWSQKRQGYLDDIFPLTGLTVSLPTKNLVVSHTYTPRQNLSNEFRFGLSLYWVVSHSAPPGKDAVADLGLQGLNLANVVDNSGGFPLFDFSEGTNFQPIGAQKDYIQQSRTFQSSDTLSWIHGRHTMQFGAEARQIGQRGPIISNPYDDFGGFVFVSHDFSFSGNAFADLLLGLPGYSFYSALGPDFNEFSSGYAFFAQDHWKVSRRLSFDFGLRWELHPPLHEQSGNITNFNPSTADVIVPDHTIPAAPGFLAAINACSVATPGPCTKVLSASQVGLPDALRHTYYRDWGPRFGFAWRPWSSDKTVLRGGIGIYTMPLFNSNAGVGVHSSDNRMYMNYQGPGEPPLFTFPDAYPGPSALGIIGVESASGVDSTLKDPRSYQWNLTVERELPWATSLRASYIGTQSVGMPATANFNQVPVNQPGGSPPFPLWGSLASFENLAFSNYQGFQAVLSHRLNDRLFLQASYVFSKNVGNAGTPRGFFPFEGSVGITDRYDTRYDRGNVAATRQHRFLVTGLFPLPFGRSRALGSRWHGFQEAILGGWELSTVSLVQSGPYQTPKFGGFGGPRPDRIGDGNLPTPTKDRYYDKSAFVPVPPNAGRLGNAGVGILEGPGTVAIATGLSKTFRVTEKLRLRVEGTFTNLPNHPNFSPPIVFVNSPQFGRLTSVQRGENAGNRTGQVAARLDF